MPIRATFWTVTFDPGGAAEVVLVDPAAALEDEISLGAEQETESAGYLEADAAEGLAFGRVRRSVTLAVVRRHASHEALRAYLFEADLAVPPRVSADLHFEVTGGVHYKIEDCVFTSWSTKPRIGGTFDTITTYSLSGGALALVP